MVQILEANPIRTPLQSLAIGLGAGAPQGIADMIAKRSEQKKELEEGQALQKLGIDPKIRDPGLRGKLLDRQTKEKQDTRRQEILSDDGLGGDATRLEKLKKLRLDPDPIVRDYANREIKELTTVPKAGAFEQTLGKKGGELAGKIQEELPQLYQDTSTIDEVENILLQDLQGITGYAKAAIGSQKAKEFENKAAPLLNRYIKIFNPAGALPALKLQWIRDQFSLKASDLTTTSQGKIESMRFLNEATKKIKEDELKLLHQYNGIIPPEELIAMGKRAEGYIDEAMDQSEQVEGDDSRPPIGSFQR